MRRPTPCLRSAPLPSLENATFLLLVGASLAGCADDVAQPMKVPIAVASGGEAVTVNVQLTAPSVYVRPAYIEPVRPTHVYVAPEPRVIVQVPAPVETESIPCPGGVAMVSPGRGG